MKKIKKESSKEQIWNKNTDLCMDVKTFLRSDRVTMIGKSYLGVLTRDSDDQYSFIETIQASAEKRNPQVFKGQFITVTRRSDGSYRPNFRPIIVGDGFSVERFAAAVANELLWALEGLIEKESTEDESK